MGEHTPREPLHERIARLAKDRRAQMLFGLGVFGALLQVLSSSLQLRSAIPIAAAVVLGAIFVIRARVIAKKRESRGMERRAEHNIVMHRLHPPTKWKQVNEALDGFRALTGEDPPAIAYKARADVGECIDAELAFISTQRGPDGTFPVVSPFDTGVPSTALYAFDEAMLDTYAAAELLAVLVHLMYRGEFARGETARLANGVREADSKALLLTREHAALLRAIEKSSRGRTTPVPGMGIIRFADADVRASKVTGAGKVAQWETRDRIADLRAHLGAMALDVPAGG